MAHNEAQSLYDLFVLKLKSLYDTEQQLVEALPKVAEAATDTELKTAFQDHLSETEEHVTRLEKVFGLIGMEPTAEESDAIRGLISDTEWCIKHIKPGNALDASLVSAAQYVEHYEIAGYGTIVEWAEMMGQPDIKIILGETLEEEETADEKLTSLAQSRINEAANIGTVGDEENKGFFGKLQTGNI